jgi:glycosyltransferase involved in cell wall biosynthesis
MSHDELLRTLIDVDRITPRLARADRVICMSHVLREACEQVGVPAEKITVLGNRVSLARFHVAPQPGYDPQVVRVLFIGRLTPQKNVHGVSAALALLKGEGWKVHLDVCGGTRVNRYLRDALAVLADDEWRYWGAVPNRRLPERYQSADLYAGPSLFEGFQIPLVEALACGKPCLAGNQPPANEIIDAEVGELVDPQDMADIARGLRQLKVRLNQPQARAEITAACRRRAVERWSYQTISAREAELYLEVLRRFTAVRG